MYRCAIALLKSYDVDSNTGYVVVYSEFMINQAALMRKLEREECVAAGQLSAGAGAGGASNGDPKRVWFEQDFANGNGGGERKEARGDRNSGGVPSPAILEIGRSRYKEEKIVANMVSAELPSRLDFSSEDIGEQ